MYMKAVNRLIKGFIMTREYKAVARHPGKGEAKNPGGPLAVLVWLAALVVAAGGVGVIALHMIRMVAGF